MHTTHTWRFDDFDEDFGWRQTLERGLLVTVVVVFVILAGWQVLQPVAEMWAEIGAALEVAR